MKKILLMCLLSIVGTFAKAQNDCATAIPITAIPFSSGAQTTCGKVNDFPAGSYANANYGAGEDFVYSINITNAPTTLNLALGGSATWKIASVHSACAPTPANSVGNVTTSSASSGSGVINIPTNGTYYIIVDTWPTPDCGSFTLDITQGPPPPNCGTLTGPANGSTVTTLTPTLSWTAPASGVPPTGYKVYLGTTNPPTTLVSTVTAPATTYTASLTQYNTQYYWYIVPTNGGADALGCDAVIWSFTSPAAPAAPANDDCANAVMLTANTGATCATPVSGTTLGATESMPAGACGGTPNDDVWYSFVATGTTHIVTLSNVVSVGNPSTTDMYFQVLSGACGSTTSLLCSDPNTGTVTGLTVGNTYYIRVYTYSGTQTAAASFDICVTSPPPPPANDDCAGAVTLTVNPDYLCGSFASGTTVNATASTETAPSCVATGTNDDVWFKFTATGTAHRITLSNVSGSTDMAMAIYSGACGSLVQVVCSDPNTLNATGLTAGTTYYVRVWTNSTSATTRASFDICVGTQPPVPANDDCSAAVVLTPSSTGVCANPVSGSTASASASTGTTPTCSATGINDDVWYSFTATSTTHLVNVIYSDNATTTQVYSGSCGSLTAVACFAGNYGNSNVLLTTLTVGQTYYVRVFSSTSTAATTSNFTICVTTPEVPANDSCSTAIAIAPNGSVTGTNALATADTLPTSTCGSTGSTASYNGVWYTVTSQVSGPITISACGTQFDAYMRVYTGDCSTLTCVANTSGVGYADAGCPGINNAPTVTFNATAGTTYYVLLTGYSATQFGTYTISTSGTLGTSNVVAETDKASVYPNPFTDIVNISDAKDLKSVSVVDMSGRMVKTIANPGRQINLSELKAGLYILKLDYKNGTSKTVKAIKK